jgi:hypothetical protein
MEMDVSRRAVELRVTENEGSPIGSDQPVASLCGGYPSYSDEAELARMPVGRTCWRSRLCVLPGQPFDPLAKRRLVTSPVNLWGQL